MASTRVAKKDASVSFLLNQLKQDDRPVFFADFMSTALDQRVLRERLGNQRSHAGSI
jgi:hypothetical protein